LELFQLSVAIFYFFKEKNKRISTAIWANPNQWLGNFLNIKNVNKIRPLGNLNFLIV